VSSRSDELAVVASSVAVPLASGYLGLLAFAPFERSATFMSVRVLDRRRFVLSTGAGVVGLVLLRPRSALALPDRPSLLAQRAGFAAPVTGGNAGSDYVVTNLDDSGSGSLRAGLTVSGARWISFAVSGVINLLSPINAAADKTVDAREGDVTLTGHGIYINGVDNVILCNLVFNAAGSDAADDAVRVVNDYDLVWIHHCSFTNTPDGLIDTTNMRSWKRSHRSTYSWNHFHHHDKVCLNNIDTLRNPNTHASNFRMSFHHNLFENNVQRQPLMHQGRFHLWNNYIREWGSGTASRVLCLGQVQADNNVYSNTGTDKVTVVTKPTGDKQQGYLRASGNLLESSVTLTQNQPSKVFSPSSYYSFTADPADERLKTAVVAGAGATL
jgi:pectate lyase